MEKQPLTIRVGGSELIAVPAVHYHHVFAREVYRLCGDPASRPDAVALELGPVRAHAIRCWMEELEIGPPSCKPLPVMLGLLSRNRLIRASLREKAMELQKMTGKDLSELSPKVLKQELGYSGYGLVPLSPTDSMIEALRCTVELGIPAHGVDLDQMPGCTYRTATIQDPLQAGSNLFNYVARNATWAVHGTDEEIDPRREFVMAARLKGMLHRYGRVLFTGGLGHWVRIRELLRDPSVKPAPIPEIDPDHEEALKRVIVHPVIAVEHMDLFPALVEKYLGSRVPLDRLHRSRTDTFESFDVLGLFEKELTKAYRSYFLGENTGRHGRQKNQELELIRGYESYLSNLCLLNRMEVPHLFQAVEAARAVMSREFTRAITESFMEFPWASPQDHGECSVLGPEGDTMSGSGWGVILDQTDGKEEPVSWDSPQNGVQPCEKKLPYHWKALDELRQCFSFLTTRHTWLPWDRLVTGLCARAMELSTSTCREERVQEFSGSLRGGIHMRSTVRSFAKGHERIYVRDFIRKRAPSKGCVDGFPVVWLIDLEEDGAGNWQVLHVPFSYMEPYVRDRARFESIRASFGAYMAAIIGYTQRDAGCSPQMEQANVSIDHHKGVIFYQPLPWRNEQFARWLEHTEYRRSPICRELGLGREESELRRMLKHQHGIDMKEHHWSTVLIMLAIPFARGVLPVVVPPGFRIEGAAREMAARYGVGLSPVSLRKFDPSEVEKLAGCYLAPVITHDPHCVYSEEVEEAIGEKQAANVHMVPKEMLEFGLADF